MGEKKRKRHGDTDGRPPKKAATGQASGKIKFELVDNAGLEGPVLASTPGLSFPSNLTFKAYKSQSRILPQGQIPSNLLLQSSDHPRLDYTAQEEKDGSSESLLNDYIGVYDPSTGKLQLVQVHKLTIRSSLRSEIEELRAEKQRIAEARQSMTVKRHALASEFGSRKSKKAIAQMAENAIARGRATADGGAIPQDEPLTSAILQGLEDTTSAMPTKADLAAAVDNSKPRPVANLTAEYPADVYPAENILGRDLLAAIEVKDWIEAADVGEAVNVHSKFVAKRILKLAQAREIQKLKVLKFILLCANFNASLKTQGRGPKKILERSKLLTSLGDNVPPAVVDGIRKRFASDANDMTRWNIDNLITHIAAASLIVDNFEVDVNDLRDDLRLENKEIKRYFEEIGCTIKIPTESERAKMKISKAETVNHNLAKLKLPLKFPQVRNVPRNRR